MYKYIHTYITNIPYVSNAQSVLFLRYSKSLCMEDQTKIIN